MRLPSCSILLLFAAALSCQQAPSGQQAGQQPAKDATARPSPRAGMLVTPQWLAAHLDDDNLVLLHVGPEANYLKQHIPGAQCVRRHDLQAPETRAPRELVLEMPSPELLVEQLQAFGIGDDSRIVVYFAEEWVSPATRVVFTLDYAGFGGRTSLLDGGLSAWVGTGHAAVNGPVAAASPTRLSPLRLQPIVVSGEWVRDNATKPGNVLFDARDAGFYDGTQAGGPRGAPKKGHIPGSKGLPFGSFWAKDDTLLPAETLGDLFRTAGAKPGDTVIAYCHIGQQATALLFAARSLGYEVRLYDGSMQDWAYRDWPVELPGKPKEDKPNEGKTDGKPTGGKRP
jgi:thiosulfate/3-mercaptopyruvate sulfurtransferase